MRSTIVTLTVSTALLIAAFQLHGHVRALLQLGRAYYTFHPYLREHPDTLYRYPSSGDTIPAFLEGTRLEEDLVIPRLVHQVFLREGRNSTLSKYTAAIQSCQQPGWNHTMWTDETARSFMRIHYPALYRHYIGYKQSIQRANIVRYALLDHFGGIYVDLDVTCIKPLDELRATNIPFLTPGAHPAGVNNAFIMSRPGHPFLRKLLHSAPSRDLYWGLPYVENMLSTGCGYFGSMWTAYTQASPRLSGDEVRILANAEGEIEPHMLRGVVTTPLFKHGGASSWHGWDAAAIVIVGKYMYHPLVLPALGLGCTCLALLVWAISLRGTRRRRRSWGARMRDVVSPTALEKREFLQPIAEETVADEEQALW